MNQMSYGNQAPPPSIAAMQQNSGGSALAPNLTTMDLSSVFGGAVQSSGGLLVQFFYYRVQFGGRQNPMKGKFETRLAVALQPRGDRLTVAVRNLTEEQAQRDFPAEWQHFKVYMDTPTTGTPLHELPGATQSMIGLLALHGIRSIEDMANLPADVCAQIGMDAQTASRLAKIWLGRKDGNQDDIMTAERLATTESALEIALAELKNLKHTTEIQARTIEAIQRMGGQQQGVSPMGIATGQPRTGTDGVLMVETDDYRATGEPAVDVFAAPHVVSDASGMDNPLDDGF